uniref:FGF-1 n=1 Tax=Hydra vulgaris TaxID=6087 RepID=A0A172PYW5_HYDVU|nr:FGF-1 [Hydra vulgaris]
MILLQSFFEKTILIFVVVKLSQPVPTLMPRNVKLSLIKDEMVKYLKHPSYKKSVLLYSKQGYFLSIADDGKIYGTHDGFSPDAQLEVQSFGVNYKRIRKPGSWYLSIDKNGAVKAENDPKNETLFQEVIDKEGWAIYRNDLTGYLLAFNKNGKLQQNLKSSKVKNKAKFLLLSSFSSGGKKQKA